METDEEPMDEDTNTSVNRPGQTNYLGLNVNSSDPSKYSNGTRRKTSPSILAVNNPNVLYNSRSWGKQSYKRNDSRSINPRIRVTSDHIDHRALINRKAG